MASETDQILNDFNPDSNGKKIDPKWQSIYDQLLAQRDQLIDSQQDLQVKAREMQPDSAKNEPSEIGTEENLMDYALGMASTEQETLAEINSAIDRIESGTYGVCEITGQPIPMERLEAVPWTRYSLEGQKQLEERGGAIKAGIGALGAGARRGTEPPGPYREDE